MIFTLGWVWIMLIWFRDLEMGVSPNIEFQACAIQSCDYTVCATVPHICGSLIAGWWGDESLQLIPFVNGIAFMLPLRMCWEGGSGNVSLTSAYGWVLWIVFKALNYIMEENVFHIHVEWCCGNPYCSKSVWHCRAFEGQMFMVLHSNLKV